MESKHEPLVSTTREQSQWGYVLCRVLFLGASELVPVGVYVIEVCPAG